MRDFAVFVVGLALYLPILRGGFQGFFFPASFFGGYAPLVLNSCVVVFALVLLALTKGNLTNFFEKQHLGVAVGCFASMACLVNGLHPNELTVALCAPFVGLYFCYATACWGVSLTRIMRCDPWRACLLVACAYVLSYVVLLPSVHVDGVAGYAYAVLPALSMLFWATHWSSDLQLFPYVQTKQLLDSKTTISIVVLIGLFEVVSSIAVGIFVPFPMSAGTFESNWVRTYLSLAVAVLLLVFVAASARFPHAQTAAWGIVVMLVIAGVALFTSGFESAASAGGDILSVGRRTAWVLLFMQFSEVAAYDRNNIIKVYGCLFCLLYEATRIPINAIRFVLHIELTQEWLYYVAGGISMALMFATFVWCASATVKTADKREGIVREVVSPQRSPSRGVCKDGQTFRFDRTRARDVRRPIAGTYRQAYRRDALRCRKHGPKSREGNLSQNGMSLEAGAHRPRHR